jgi:hypothetical protein
LLRPATAAQLKLRRMLGIKDTTTSKFGSAEITLAFGERTHQNSPSLWPIRGLTMREFADKAKPARDSAPGKAPAQAASDIAALAYANPILQLQDAIGNRALLHLLRTRNAKAASAPPATAPEQATPAANLVAAVPLLSSPIQRKAIVSTPGDPSEQEADRVAEQVMRMPEPSAPTESIASGISQSAHSITPTMWDITAQPQPSPAEACGSCRGGLACTLPCLLSSTIALAIISGSPTFRRSVTTTRGRAGRRPA